jgi:GH35 family endo-1,4-beta-xylanase
MTTVVHTFYEKQMGLRTYCSERLEISLVQDVEETFRKALALAAGSYFEVEVTQALEKFARDKSNGNDTLVSFVRNKALARQFHTFFNWKAANADKFFGLLGEEFKSRMKARIDADSGLSEAIRNFMAVGDLRNKAAHQNFATFTTDKTSEEIMQAFESALHFLCVMREELDK